MTKNSTIAADLPPPLAPQPSDVWNTFAASLPGLVSFLQPSVDTSRIASDGSAWLYDRKKREWWKTADEVAPGALGPTLLALQSGGRACLQWPGTGGTNPLRSPAGVSLPAEGTLFLLPELSTYEAPCTLFESATTTGNYIKIALTADGKIEVTGAGGGVLASTSDITPYEGPAGIMFSWSAAGGRRVSLNGVIGATTTSGAYVPNSDALDMAAGLDDGARLHAALILDADFHVSAYDAQRAAFFVATGQAFGAPFSIDWDFVDLGSDMFLYLNPAALADGDVATWTDTASGIALTEASNRPSRASADLNGHPSVTFVRANSDKLRNLALPAAIPSGHATSEIHMLASQDTASTETATTTLLGYGASGSNAGRNIQRTSDGTANRLRISTNNTGSYVDGSFDFSGINAVGGRWADGIESGYGNGSFLGQLSTAFNTSATRFALGCSPSSSGSPTGFADMKVGVVVGGNFTDAQRDLIHGKMCFLGGVQSKLPDGHPYRRATFV